MSSIGRRQAGFDRDRARDHRDSHLPAAQIDHEYAESELSYISAFEDLNLNSARNAQYPTATMSPSRPQNTPGRPYHGLSPLAELRPMQGNVQSTEPQLEHDIDAHNSLGLVPANHMNPLPAGAPRSLPSRPLRQNVENPYYNAYYSRQEGHASAARPSWWRSSSEFARPPERGFRGYRPYPEEDRFMGSRRTEMTLECQCRTCIEHRHAIRNWAFSRYDNRGIPPRSNHYPYTYSGQSSRGRYPTEVARLYRNEDYSPGNDSDYSSYRSDSPVSDGYRDYAISNSRQPNPRTTDPGNVYYESDGSGHEDSDNASYTGYERYDEYGDEYGEYGGRMGREYR